jgi:antitoxin component YwqK of YwqJK toxin-antitoxin module
MSTRLCGGKRVRSRSPSPETIAKRINTLHIGPLPTSPLAGRKRNGSFEEYSIVEPIISKRSRETFEEVEESTDTIKEKYSCDRKGQKQGTYESWYGNRQRCELSTYYNGHEEGLSQHWYSNGKPFMIYTTKSGLKEGNAYTWFQSGMIKTVEPYTSGLLHGTVTHFCESGNKIQETMYEHGELVKESFWNADGDLVFFNNSSNL